ncbi:MFS transporter [Lentibacillus sp. N15]|uniref:MFS transporter n=1 Tax=Lentibacillus songyuanensis TaxID=3136161 RepID=UPI0031BA6156
MSRLLVQRLQLFTSWITLFIIGTDLFVVSPLLPLIAEQFGVTPSKAGWMVTTFSLMYALGAPGFGILSDRLGRRKLIVGGLVGFMIANILTGTASTFNILIGSRVLAGISASAITSSVFAVTGDSAPEGKSGRWLAIVTTGFLTALWLGAPIGTVAGKFLGWNYVFIVLGIAAVILLVFNYRMWSTKETAQQKSETNRELKRILLNVAVTMFWAWSVYGLYTYLGTGLQSVQHLSSILIAVALIVYGIGAISGSLLGGRFADVWTGGSVSTTSLVALGIVLLLLGWLFSTWLLWILLAFWAFSGYVAFSSYQARLAKEFPDNLGSAMAWNQTAMYAGITLGSIFGGWIINHWPYTLLPIISGGFAFVAAIWCYRCMKIS